ncbi:amidase [Pantoea vagans]|uniref:amidase n=1 Tax=Pantoea vagans TaxID=470934 RepID=UPI0023B1E51C|nr:amidase [Pantoea vagans]MDE8559322.1 amidase [Pantoea vagans]MDE8579322.1 amidase [Pantoea vagans]
MNPEAKTLATLPAHKMLAGYRDGAFTPSDVIEDVLQRITTLDPYINAFINVQADSARKQATDISASAASMQRPLAGIPVAIKDIIDVKGLPTTCHSAVMAGHVAASDAEVVRHLREAGAIIVGKLSTHEFALGGPSFELPYPPARNPWNTAHLPGGSSSGSAAAVAARMVPITLGTDTAGSIRFPAGSCGVLGIKPTFGTVPCDGVFPLAYSLDHVGPLAHNADDLALALNVLGSRSPHGASLHEATPSQPLKGLRVGYIDHFHTQDLHASPEVSAGINDFAETLARLGATVSLAKLPPLQDFLGVNRVVMYAEAWAVHAPWMRERPEQYGKACRRSFMAGAFITNEQYLRAQRARRLLVEKVESAFHQFDVLLAVSMHDAPSRIDDEEEVRRTTARQARAVFSLTGHPAISIPAGVTAAGLPLAVQLAAPWYHDDTLINVARVIEAHSPWPAPKLNFQR